MPLIGRSHLPFVVNNGIEGPQARYLCHMCRAIMIRTAMDDNADPIWDLYAG